MFLSISAPLCICVGFVVRYEDLASLAVRLLGVSYKRGAIDHLIAASVWFRPLQARQTNYGLT